MGLSKVSDKISQEDNLDINLSSSIEGLENVKVTEIIRNINVSSYGLVNIEDRITILNQNLNPIDSILLGIPLEHSDDLIYLKSKGIRKNALVVERNYLTFNEYEIISIYLETPLLSQESTFISIVETFKNLLNYKIQNLEQRINFTGFIFPILPYKAEGTIRSAVRLPSGANALSYDQPFGMGTPLSGVILYDLINSLELAHIDPFLENMGEEKEITVIIEDNVRTSIQLDEITREIFFSPWGIIKVREEHTIHNTGKIDVISFAFKIPDDAINLFIYDELGELLGSSIGGTIGKFKEVTIDLLTNRVAIKPDSKLKYSIEYYVPVSNHFSINWFEGSLNLDLVSTKHKFLAINQEIKLIIEGCGDIDYLSTPPDAINQNSESKILIYESSQVSPLETKEILITFSINLFNLLFRPLIIILLFAFILSSFVLIQKLRKKEERLIALKTELIPINEIREFCSLYEEKNALMLENRKAEDEAKRKKMAKKSYKNIVSKNTNKIEQIKSEIQPFKKVLIESGENFESIVKKLDILDAERVSVDDSINLLDNRYKRGKLPSRQAYQKLSDDFLKRRKKIDRTIDKYVQQLRSYLL